MAKERTYLDDYEEFLAILNKHKVEYLIIGSYATMHHTKKVRSTEDFDIWVNPSEENACRVYDTIKEFFGVVKGISKNDFLRKDSIVFMGKEPYKINIFTKQGNLPFSNVWRNKDIGKFGKTKVKFISKKHLIRIKEHYKSEKRPQDFMDLMWLRNKK